MTRPSPKGPRRATLTALAVLAPGLSCTSGDPAPLPTRLVLLVTLDTVPAEDCSLYGYDKPTTPFLEELGARGTVFDHHVVNSNNTLVSHASILTGMLPPTHGAHDRGAGDRRVLAPEFETLAERFQAEGWTTAGFATHAIWLTPAFGIAQGFDHFESRWRDAHASSRAFLDWLDAERPERAFVFLHFFDAHSDGSRPGADAYAAPPELVERFAGERPADFTGAYEDRTGKVFHGSQALAILSNPWREVPPEHLAWIRGTYDAGLAQLDRALRDLFGELEARGVLDRALVVITSDHGEEFKQHGSFLHRQSYDEVLHVPLIVDLPRDVTPARSRVGELTTSVDLAPTILELVGLDPLPLAQGRSFASALLEGEPIPWEDTLFHDVILRARDEGGEYKVHADPRKKLLFDLDADPGETHSVFETTDRRRLADARVRLRRLLRDCRRVRRLVAAGEAAEPEMSTEELERLRALGYLGEEEERHP